MPFKISSISNIVLWVCILFAVATLIVLYITGEPDFILYCVYGYFLLMIVLSIVFTIWQFFRNWKEDRASVWKPILFFIVLISLFGTTYLIGDSTPLELSDDLHKENTTFFLKLTDMWLYSIYILSGLTILSVIGGIIWSYLKK